MSWRERQKSQYRIKKKSKIPVMTLRYRRISRVSRPIKDYRLFAWKGYKLINSLDKTKKELKNLTK